MVSSDLLVTMAEDAEAPDTISDADLNLVSLLAERQVALLGEGIKKGPTGDAIQGLRDWAKKNELQADPLLKEYNISSLIGALVERLSEYREISEKKLPEAMLAIGMEKFTMSNGYEVSIDEDVRASVKAGEGVWLRLIPWLEAHGLDGIAKAEVKLNFSINDEGINLETEVGRVLFDLAVKHRIIAAEAEKLTRGEAIEALAREEGLVGEEKYSINAQTLKSVVKTETAKGVEFPEDLFSIQRAKKATVNPPKKKKEKK